LIDPVLANIFQKSSEVRIVVDTLFITFRVV